MPTFKNCNFYSPISSFTSTIGPNSHMAMIAWVEGIWPLDSHWSLLLPVTPPTQKLRASCHWPLCLRPFLLHWVTSFVDAVCLALAGTWVCNWHHMPPHVSHGQPPAAPSTALTSLYLLSAEQGRGGRTWLWRQNSRGCLREDEGKLREYHSSGWPKRTIPSAISKSSSYNLGTIQSGNLEHYFTWQLRRLRLRLRLMN